jgi:hypothetical protein
MKIFMVVEEEDAWRHSAFYMLDHAFSSAFSSLLSFGFYNAKLMRGAYISRLKQLVQCTQACTGRGIGRARLSQIDIPPRRAASGLCRGATYRRHRT